MASLGSCLSKVSSLNIISMWANPAKLEQLGGGGAVFLKLTLSESTQQSKQPPFFLNFSLYNKMRLYFSVFNVLCFVVDIYYNSLKLEST